MSRHSVLSCAKSSSAHTQCVENSLSVNADKTVIVPFTNKRDLRKLRVPRLNGKTITYSNTVKYLGVTLDQRLNWNSHIENVIQRAKTSLGISYRMAGTRWGITPKIALWLYTAIVRPIVCYAAAVWYKKTLQKSTIDKLNSLQRTACLIITGAMSTSPGIALNALLNIQPLHIFAQREAKACILRVNPNKNRKWQSKCLINLQEDATCLPVLKMTTDTMTPTYNFTKNYTVKFPSRDDWLKGQTSIKDNCLTWYTDGSKKGNDVGSGIYGENPRLRQAQNLGNYASIFQAEVYAITACAGINLSKRYVNQHITINSDSQAALLAIDSPIVRSKLVQDCVSQLNALGKNNQLVLQWVPGHSDIEGNEKADELARRGTKNHFTVSFGEAIKLWCNTPGMCHSKALIKGYNRKFANGLLALSKDQICTLARSLTGHCKLNKHMHTLNLSDTTGCRFCEEEMETPMHLLCDCGPLMYKRSTHLGRQVLTPEEIQTVPIKNLLRFLAAVGIGKEL